MPISESDPRVYLAAERTLLAWLRTGLTVMAFGFVIARFGLFVQIVSAQAPGIVQYAHSGASALFGVVLVALGTLMILAAAVQHKRFIATLPAPDRPPGYSGDKLILASSALITLVGIALTVYLAASAV
jgi:putative membrane protein